MSQMLHDAPHLAVASFANGDGQPGIARHLPIQPRRHPAVANAVDGDAFGERLKRCRVDLPLHTHPVFAAPPGTWKLQMPRQTAVIGQQQEAFGIKVQPTDRQHPRQGVRKPVEDCFTSLLVTVADDQPARLVVAPQARRLTWRKRLSVDRDAVGGADVECGAENRLAIHRHPAIGYPCFGLAARADAGARDVLGDTFRSGRRVNDEGRLVVHGAVLPANASLCKSSAAMPQDRHE